MLKLAHKLNTKQENYKTCLHWFSYAFHTVRVTKYVSTMSRF